MVEWRWAGSVPGKYTTPYITSSSSSSSSSSPRSRSLCFDFFFYYTSEVHEIGFQNENLCGHPVTVHSQSVYSREVFSVSPFSYTLSFTCMQRIAGCPSLVYLVYYKHRFFAIVCGGAHFHSRPRLPERGGRDAIESGGVAINCGVSLN